MERIINRNGKHTGYRIGKVKIHAHLDYPDSWLMTCAEVGLDKWVLCPKDYQPWQIAALVHNTLVEKRDAMLSVYNQAIKLSKNVMMENI